MILLERLLEAANTSHMADILLCAAADIFLGEAGQLLVRNVDFEIPYLKQQAAKEQQQLADLERKHTEHLHSAVHAARQYQQVSDSSKGIKHPFYGLQLLHQLSLRHSSWHL